MLREVVRPDGSKVAFEYDAFARRTKKRLLNAAGEVLRETRYVWDGHVIVHELGGDEDELITWRFEPETFTPIAKEQGARRWAIASDHLGTPTEMVDELGKLAWKMQLDVLGVPAFEEGDGAHCPFRWPGQYEDEETGLYYNRFRYYDPEQGGYTADDPIGLKGGIRLRGYVEDPWTWVDPWGLSGCRARYGFDARAQRYRDFSNGHFISARDLPWPPNAGFSTRTRGVVTSGTIIDRYGGRSGRYASEGGTSVSARGLPPASEALAFERYKVTRAFEADVGTAGPVPAFGASGGAKQYFFDRSIQPLIDGGLLEVIR